MIYDDDNGHVDAVLDIMASFFPNTTDAQALCAVHPEYDGCDSILAAMNADHIGTNSTCYEWASYLPFKEGWTLRYFDSEDDFEDFITDSKYG